MLENATLRDLAKISLKMNGRSFLALDSEERGVQTESAQEEEEPSSNSSVPSQNRVDIPPTVPVYAHYASDFHTSNLIASEAKAPSSFASSRISNLELK